MSLQTNVVERLLLSKFLLEGIRSKSTAAPDRLFLASQIIDAHDGAEIALAAIVDQLGVPIKRPSYLMDYFEPLKQYQHPPQEVPGKGYFIQLNQVRNDIKHHGIIPDPKQWRRVGENVYDRISEWCTTALVFRRWSAHPLERLRPAAFQLHPELAFHDKWYRVGDGILWPLIGRPCSLLALRKRGSSPAGLFSPMERNQGPPCNAHPVGN